MADHCKSCQPLCGRPGHLLRVIVPISKKVQPVRLPEVPEQADPELEVV